MYSDSARQSSMRNWFPKVSQSTGDENILAPISVGQEQSFGNDFIYMFDGGKSSEIIQATKSMEKFFKSDFFFLPRWLNAETR